MLRIADPLSLYGRLIVLLQAAEATPTLTNMNVRDKARRAVSLRMRFPPPARSNRGHTGDAGHPTAQPSARTDLWSVSAERIGRQKLPRASGPPQAIGWLRPATQRQAEANARVGIWEPSWEPTARDRPRPTRTVSHDWVCCRFS